MATPRRAPSHLTYAYISAAAFVLALVAAAVLVLLADRFSRLSTAAYYLLLLPIALAAAAFLFGAMRSHARYRGEVARGSLELGGPVVVFAMVMLGGVFLASPDTTANVTVRLSSTVGPEDRISAGEVVLDLGDDRRTRAVGPDGQATFTQVPVQFLNAELGVIARVDRYRMASAGPFHVSPLGIIEVPLEPVRAETVVSGTILDATGPVEGATVNFAHGAATALTDANGNFRLTVPFERTAQVPVLVTIGGRVVYSDNYVVSPEQGLRVRLEEEVE